MFCFRLRFFIGLLTQFFCLSFEDIKNYVAYISYTIFANYAVMEASPRIIVTEIGPYRTLLAFRN